MLNEALYNNDDSESGQYDNLGTIRSSEKAPESLRIAIQSQFTQSISRQEMHGSDPFPMAVTKKRLIMYIIRREGYWYATARLNSIGAFASSV